MEPGSLLVPLLPGVVGGVFLFLGLYLAVRERRFLRRAHRVPGLTVPSSSNTRVTFETRDGRVITAEPAVSFTQAAGAPYIRAAGRPTTVLYSPTNPSDIRLDGITGTFLLPAVGFCVLGFLALVVAVVLLWLVLTGVW